MGELRDMSPFFKNYSDKLEEPIVQKRIESLKASIRLARESHVRNRQGYKSQMELPESLVINKHGQVKWYRIGCGDPSVV